MSTLQDVINGTVKEVKQQPKEEKKEVKHLEKPKLERQKHFQVNEIKNTDKKIIIARNRNMSFQEIVMLNKLYSVLEFRYSFHGSKNINNLLFEVLIVDATDKKSFSWLQKNIEEVMTDKYLYINLCIDGKHLDNKQVSELKTIYHFDRILKHLPTDVKDISEYVFELCDHLSKPQSGCLDTIYRAVSNYKKKGQKN